MLPRLRAMRRATVTVLRSAALITALGLPAPGWCVEVNDVWELLDAGSPREAYQLAKESLPEGTPDRDLVLGVAAADAGDYQEAVTRLKRHLEAFPAHRQNPRAHLELGRAYFRLGQLDSAQAEFEDVLKQNPPEAVAKNIRQALDAIAEERNALSPKFGGFMEVGLGYDSNINSGVTNPDITVPVLGEIHLGQGSVEQDGGIATAALGVEVNKAVSRDLGLFASARADTRLHNNHSDLDQLSTSLSAGAAKMLGKNMLRGSLAWTGMRLNWETYRDAYNATLEWNRNLDERTGMGVYGQIGVVTYTGSNSARDADTYTLGAAYSRAFEGALKPLLRLSGSYTLEENRRGHKSLGRDVPSLRAGLELKPTEKWSVNGALTWQQAKHHAIGDVNTRRQDEYYAASLGAGYQFNQRWSAGAEAEYSRNTSNVALYEYKRTAVMFKVRCDFR